MRAEHLPAKVRHLPSTLHDPTSSVLTAVVTTVVPEKILTLCVDKRRKSVHLSCRARPCWRGASPTGRGDEGAARTGKAVPQGSKGAGAAAGSLRALTVVTGKATPPPVLH